MMKTITECRVSYRISVRTRVRASFKKMKTIKISRVSLSVSVKLGLELGLEL